MTYKLEQKSPSGRITYEARGSLDIWSEVISMGLFIWGLLFMGSLGIGFIFVAEVKVPTHNDLWTMLGIAFVISAASALAPVGYLWGNYQSRVRPYEDAEYYLNDDEDIDPGDNIWQQTSPNTIARTAYKYSSVVLHDLAVRCFNPDSSWRETEYVRRLPFEGIGITNVERKYQAEEMQRDFVRLGWMIKVDERYRWTSRGKRELWKHYPPTAQGYD